MKETTSRAKRRTHATDLSESRAPLRERRHVSEAKSIGRTVSISKIFKSHNKASHMDKSRDKVLQGEGLHAKSSEHRGLTPAKVGNLNKSGRKRNPRSSLLAESLEDTRMQLIESSNTALERVHQSLRQEVSQDATRLENMARHVDRLWDSLYKPLDDTRLISRPSLERGDDRISSTLGDRMDELQSFVDQKSTQLEELWREWRDIQKEIIELGIDILGPAHFVPASPSNPNSITGLSVREDRLSVEESRLNDLYNSKEADIMKEIEELRAETMKKLEQSEKEFQVTRNQKRERLVNMLAEKF